jgi:hypothetical protein
VDKVVTISLYTGVKQELDGSNKGRVNIIQWLGVENTQFSLCGFRGASHWAGLCVLSIGQEMIPAMRQLRMCKVSW